jgi:hypothetical protein
MPFEPARDFDRPAEVTEVPSNLTHDRGYRERQKVATGLAIETVDRALMTTAMTDRGSFTRLNPAFAEFFEEQRSVKITDHREPQRKAISKQIEHQRKAFTDLVERRHAIPPRCTGWRPLSHGGNASRVVRRSLPCRPAQATAVRGPPTQRRSPTTNTPRNHVRPPRGAGTTGMARSAMMALRGSWSGQGWVITDPTRSQLLRFSARHTPAHRGSQTLAYSSSIHLPPVSMRIRSTLYMASR